MAQAIEASDRGKYAELIDAETWEFIDRTDAWYPPDTTDMPVERQREIYDRMCREFFSGYPDGITAKTTFLEADGLSVPVRRYSLDGAVPEAHVVYYHGGGFVVGGLESHDDVCAEICERTGFDVTSVDYRLAPEHRHPAAFDDALAAFQAVSSATSLPVILAGDSAGGNLAAAVCHAVRGTPRQPAGQVPIYPGLGGDIARGSYVEYGSAPMLTTHDTVFYTGVRASGADLTSDPTFAPLADTDFSGLPPTVLITAECDPLADDGGDYRDRVIEAGGKAVWFNEKGLVHGYLRARHSVELARRSFTRIVDAIDALGHGRWPY